MDVRVIALRDDVVYSEYRRHPSIPSVRLGGVASDKAVVVSIVVQRLEERSEWVSSENIRNRLLFYRPRGGVGILTLPKVYPPQTKGLKIFPGDFSPQAPPPLGGVDLPLKRNLIRRHVVELPQDAAPQRDGGDLAGEIAIRCKVAKVHG